MSVQNPQFHSSATIVYKATTLADLIRKSYGGAQIIGIDGFPSAGKTTLAGGLSMFLDADVVSTDDHVEIQGGNREYIDRLNLAGIKDSAEKSIHAGRRVILEGICLREIIARSEIPAGSIVHVYVKQLSKNSDLWHDGWVLEDFKAGDFVGRGVELSAFRYHEKVCPHKLANFEFRWQG